MRTQAVPAAVTGRDDGTAWRVWDGHGGRRATYGVPYGMGSRPATVGE
jgi:hypothetical protein